MNRFSWLLAGILSLIGGFIALTNPFAATLTAEMLAGWLLLFSGIAVVVRQKQRFARDGGDCWRIFAAVGHFPAQ